MRLRLAPSDPSRVESTVERAGVREESVLTWTRGTSPARAADGLLDLVVAILATWTVVYHVSLVLHVAARPAALAEAVVLLVWFGAWWWSSRSSRSTAGSPLSDVRERKGLVGGYETPSRLTASLRGAAVLFTALGAAAFAADTRWVVTTTLWLLAAATGTLSAHRRLVETLPPGGASSWGPRSGGAGGDAVCLAWALGLAALSMFTLRPNPDDLYYVNLSQWVTEHGTFPVRDTIFSNQALPMASWPPMASYDSMVGVLARLLGLSAPDVVYVVVPPLMTFLSVLALWRLLRTWQVRAVPVALSVALVFLLLDAAPGYATPGNLFLTRIWQGKVILLCLLVPVLLVYAVRYVERPTWHGAARLLAGGIAAVGLSTSAIFLVPILAVAGTAPLALRRPVLALRGAVAMAGYPVVAGVVTVALHGHSADDFEARRLYRFDPAWFGHQVFLAGPVALVGVAAVLAGCLLVPHPGARLTTALLTLAVGITFIPGVTRLSYDLLGLGPTLWRVSWLTTTAALVGVLAVSLSAHRIVGRLWPLLPLVLVATMAIAGQPLWTGAAGVQLVSPPHWQRSPDSVAAARQLTRRLPRRAVVLAAPDLAITVDVMTTRIKTVAPRKYFLDYLESQPGFHFAERSALMDFVDPPPGRRSDPTKIERALTTVDVRAVCLPPDAVVRLGFLADQGFAPFLSSPGYACVERP